MAWLLNKKNASYKGCLKQGATPILGYETFTMSASKEKDCFDGYDENRN